jgi:molybdenum cofactor cytidylyltransferase
MGRTNKLTAELGGSPVVRIVAEACLASRARPVLVVTGHQADEVEAALAGLDIRIVRNPDHCLGMSTSLRCGIGSLPDDVGGAVICLGDMPMVSAGVIDRLIEAWSAAREAGQGHTICIPVRDRRRGNPVLIDRAHFTEIQGLEGDVGARTVIARHVAQVQEVEVHDDGILADVDTPEELAALRGTVGPR